MTSFFSRLVLTRFQNVFDPANRNDDPIGPVVEFVANFVDGFIEQISLQEYLQVVGILRNEDGAGGRLQIALQENRALLTIPKSGPTFQKWHVFGAHGRLPESAIGSVLK